MFVEAFKAANNNANGKALSKESDTPNGEHQGDHSSHDGVGEHPEIEIIDNSDQKKNKVSGKKRIKKSKKVDVEGDDVELEASVESIKRAKSSKLPSSEWAMWMAMATRIIGSVAVIAEAISQGLAVVKTSRLAYSDRVKEGAMLLTAAYDESGELEIEIYQLVVDESLTNSMKLFKVASSNLVATNDLDMEAQLGT